MDVSKAFDYLPHGLLVSKLHACELLADYLRHRQQRVKTWTAKSSWRKLAKGVPQGSILGHLLLNIFINELFLFIENCTQYNHADDNSMSYSSTTLQNVMSNLCFDCEITTDWFYKSGMKANPTKFHFMILSTNSTDDIELKLGRNTTLCSGRSVRALGVTIDYRLTFNDYVSACCLKAGWQLNAMARISKYLDSKSEEKKTYLIVS